VSELLPDEMGTRGSIAAYGLGHSRSTRIWAGTMEKVWHGAAVQDTHIVENALKIFTNSFCRLWHIVPYDLARVSNTNTELQWLLAL